MDFFNTLEQAIEQAAKLARYAKDHQCPMDVEVVKTRQEFNIQPAGMHKLFKTHKLMHVEFIPEN